MPPLVPPRLSKWLFPTSLVPRRLSKCLPGVSQVVQLVLSCLPGASLVPPGCPNGSFLPPWCLPASPVPPWRLAGCPISPFLLPWCLPGASQAVQMILACLLGASLRDESCGLLGCPSGFSVAGCLPGKQKQIGPWQITGVSWSCLGRLLESFGLALADYWSDPISLVAPSR